MPIGPIKYLADAPDPMTQALKGIQIASSLRNMKAQNDAQDAANQAANQAQEAKARYRLDVENAFDEGTPSAFAKLSSNYPGQAKAFKQSLSMLNEAQQKNEIKVAGNIYSALQGGNTEMANDIIDKRIAAMEASGDDTTSLISLKENIAKDPKNATSMSAMFLSSIMGPKDFLSTFVGIQDQTKKTKLEAGVIAKQAADLGLSKAQTAKIEAETKNLGLKEKEIALKLEALKIGKTLDSKDRFDQEDKLRDEYAAKTKNYSNAKTTFDNIKSSASDNSGAGDLALVFSFMKMLDPGSVVRESEFALAKDTAGLFQRLQNQAQKIQDGQFLTPSQRKSFAGLAKQYMASTSKHEKRVKDSYGAIIQNYGLNPDNVFGGSKKKAEEVVAQTTETVTPEGTTATETITITPKSLSDKYFKKGK